MRILGALFIATIVSSTVANASPPMPKETIAAISEALPQCSGGWIELGRRRGEVKAVDLIPRLSLLSRPSEELDQSAAGDLYAIAKGFLAPATGTPDWRPMDGESSLRCAALPKEGVALMKYLAGEEPGRLKGPSNAFEWLGLAYETGAAGARDQTKARRYYLLFQMHSGFSRNNRWSDGVDGTLLGNVERAGLRPYLEKLANTGARGGTARIALAEAALSTDPMAARRLLRYLDDRSANRLLELEDQNRVSAVHDADEIDFWAEAARTLFGYRKFAARMLQSVERWNGGTIPTSPQRVPIDLLRSYLDRDNVADADATSGPIPVRALVTPQGRAIWIEACQAAPAQSLPVRNLVVQLDAARLYSAADITKLPNLPVVKVQGRPQYTWVILPAVHFMRSQEGKQEIRFVDLPMDYCTHSAIANAPPAPIIGTAK